MANAPLVTVWAMPEPDEQGRLHCPVCNAPCANRDDRCCKSATYSANAFAQANRKIALDHLTDARAFIKSAHEAFEDADWTGVAAQLDAAAWSTHQAKEELRKAALIEQEANRS